MYTCLYIYIYIYQYIYIYIYESALLWAPLFCSVSEGFFIFCYLSLQQWCASQIHQYSSCLVCKYNTWGGMEARRHSSITAWEVQRLHTIVHMIPWEARSLQTIVNIILLSMEDPNNSKYITLEAFNPPKHSKHNNILVKIEAPCYGKYNTLEAL